MLIGFLILSVLSFSSGVIIDCSYITTTWTTVGDAYTCEARVINHDTSTRLITGVSQNHASGKSNSHVKAIRVQFQTLSFFPENFNHFFANVRALTIGSTSGVKIMKNDLRQFPQLEYFSFPNNSLQIVDGDLFAYTPNLKYINFQDNVLTNIGQGILSNYRYSNHIYFQRNVCINRNSQNGAEKVTLARELAFKCPAAPETVERFILEGSKHTARVNEITAAKIDPIKSSVQKLESKVAENHEKTINELIATTKKLERMIEDSQDESAAKIRRLETRIGELERIVLDSLKK